MQTASEKAFGAALDEARTIIADLGVGSIILAGSTDQTNEWMTVAKQVARLDGLLDTLCAERTN